ncbi:MAG: hypothetical protein JWP01_808 [Myxococcales bacterium]|nr:hypothetical protein [Myxococcales bacterium]
MIGRLLCGALLALSVLAGPATAELAALPEEPAPAPSDPAPAVVRPAVVEPAVSFSHKGQFQASVRLGVGMRAIVPYEKGEFCGASDSSTGSGNAPVCSGRAPFSMDLELGYGVARRIDTFVELRIGLESDFPAYRVSGMAGPRVFHVSPGARFFFSDAKSSKLFTTAQLVFDFSGYQDQSGASRGTDVGVRNLNGIWLDLQRSYGIYAYVGETATFARWLRFELEAGIGISGRYR